MTYGESTIEPAITEPVNTPMPFKQLTNEENLITSFSLEISYKILNDDNPKPENVKPAKRLIISDTIILPFPSNYFREPFQHQKG